MKLKTLKKDIFCGLTAACIFGTYSICVTAALGLNVWCAFFCALCCAVFSIGFKDKVYSPMVYLVMPLTVLTGNGLTELLPVCCVLGVLVYAVLSRAFKNLNIPSSGEAGIALGISLLATVIFTNLYFGIGASGATGLDMLRSYRSLGFHPDFRGLLYGTITLFAMITYPFKYRKLNKHLPAEFVTVLIPLMLNLFLNPQKELTVSNELTVFSAVDFSDIFIVKNVADSITPKAIVLTLYCAIALGGILFYYSAQAKNTKCLLKSNIASGILSGIPVKERDIIHFSPVSATVSVIVCGVVMLLFTGVIERIPMYSVGAMLIVSAWQNLPYRKIAQSVKAQGVLAIFVIVICTAAFVVFDITTALLISLIVSFAGRRLKHD